MKPTPEKLLEVALSMLPLHHEGDRRRDSLSEEKLRKEFIQYGAGEETALALVYTLRRQLEALCLLDPRELQEGNWTFVSYPASLLGRSWFMTLATTEQTLFPSDYWKQGDVRPDEIKEKQRSLLELVETNRVRNNSQAKTIRTVQVAAAFIRWGNNFLLHLSEDKKRSGKKTYVLPSGRFSLSDLSVEDQKRPDILMEIFNPDSKIVADHIVHTLKRGLEEETKLVDITHYNYKLFEHQTPIYRTVEGTSNRYAYTSYKFTLFQIKLTPAGETNLLDKVSASDGKLTWFSIDDIIGYQRADGASAFVDILKSEWGVDELKQRLLSVPDSRTTCHYYDDETHMLDLPGFDGKFHIGKPGKERSVMPTPSLDTEEWQLVMLLGWHARNFAIQEIRQIRLLGNGWIDAGNIITLVKSLQNKIQPYLPNLIEIREERFASLRISPDILFFPTELFHYTISDSNKQSGEFRLERQELKTPWGRLQEGYYEKGMTKLTSSIVHALEEKKYPAVEWEKNLREQFGKGVRGIGLRRFWSNKGKSPCLIEGLRKSGES